MATVNRTVAHSKLLRHEGMDTRYVKILVTHVHIISFNSVYCASPFDPNSFMQKNCMKSCAKEMHRDPETRQIKDDQEEFYELSAKTAFGKILSMEQFEGYVTVIVNAGRVCGKSVVRVLNEVYYYKL